MGSLVSDSGRAPVSDSGAAPHAAWNSNPSAASVDAVIFSFMWPSFSIAVHHVT
jgi:hypothetical protein